MICNVTGRVYLQDGRLAKNYKIYIAPAGPVIPGLTGSLLPNLITVKTDNKGEVDFTIADGVYQGFYTIGNKKYSFAFNVPDQPRADFADCLIYGDYDCSWPCWLEQALEARDEAIAAAELSKVNNGFNSRDELVDYASSNTPKEGTVFFAEGFAYRYTGGSSFIDDLDGYIPMGDVFPDHWKSRRDGEDMRWAIEKSAWYLHSIGGGLLRFTADTYSVSDTTIIPSGVQPQGAGKYDLWGETVGLGTVIMGIGSGVKRRWRDVTGSDAADENPIFVAGGNGVYFRDITFDSPSSTPWTRAVIYPCVKQCGFERIQTTNNFTRGAVLLDLTWSDRNTTLRELHPTVKTSTGMNEFWGVHSFLQGRTFGLEIGGTTRNPADYPVATDWLWGWGGASDSHFEGIRATGLRVDAALNNAAGAVQGVWFHDCAWRVGSREWMIDLDRANRIQFMLGYAEQSSAASTYAKIGLTSRTTNILFFGGRYIGNRIWYNGVDTGQSLDNGNAGLSEVTVVKSDGSYYVGNLVINGNGVAPRSSGSAALGSSSNPFSVTNTHLVRSRDTELSLRSDGDNLNLMVGSSTMARINSSGMIVSGSIIPDAAGTQAIGGTSTPYLNANVRNVRSRDSDLTLRSDGGNLDLLVGSSTRARFTSTGIGFNGAVPVARATLPAAATDAASTQALVNAIRTALINLGLAQ